MKSESIGKIALALSKAQLKIIGAVKESNNPFFNSTYADLASVMSAIRIPFAENELSYAQPIVVVDGKHFVNTILMHSSGEYIESMYPIVCKDFNDPQKVGSGTSYARRYSLASICGVPQVDDDGNSASNLENKKEDSNSIKNLLKPAFLDPFEKGIHQEQSKEGAQAWGKSFKIVTEGQLKRLFAIQAKSSLSKEEVAAMIKLRYNKDSSKELNMEEYDDLCSLIEEYKTDL